MHKSFWCILLTIILGGCQGYVPATMLAVPPAVAPLHFSNTSTEGGTARREEHQVFAGIDYTTGPGYDEGEDFYLVRPHLAVAIEDEKPFHGIIGLMGLEGKYRARMWGHYYSDHGITHDDESVYGLGVYMDINSRFTRAFATIGFGMHIMVGWEDGNYTYIWDRSNHWPFPLAVQLSGYSFLQLDFTESVKLALRGGIASPTSQLYINGTFAWNRVLVGFGSGQLKDRATCYTAGISFRL
jgi:hypothetical protein